MLAQLTNWGTYFMTLPMFPIFDIAHDYLAAADVRHTWGANFPRKSPVCVVVSWLLTIATTFAGGLIASLFLEGQSLLSALTDMKDMLLLLASGVWFAVSYSPYDICYRFGENFAVNLIFNILKEIYRVRKIHQAVFDMTYVWQGSWLVKRIFIGVVRANGAGLFKQFLQCVQKTRFPSSDIKIETSFTTKACLVASLLFVMKYEYDIGATAVSAPMLHLGFVVFFVFSKVRHLWQQHNALKPKKD